MLICGNSSQLSLAHDKVIKYVGFGLSNCLTIANASYKNCFKYAWLPLNELKNENASSVATKLSSVLLKLFSIVYFDPHYTRVGNSRFSGKNRGNPYNH